MRKTVFELIILSVACVSCGLYEIGGVEDSASGGVWGGPFAGESGEDAVELPFYMTALDYKDGYDWRSDQARENVKCSLVVYVDGIPKMKIPVGEAYESVSDPDMHRIIDGHLYTCFFTDDETVLRKDGMPLFRYEGSEIVCGMEVLDEEVYTLGQAVSGTGFTFRRNGEIVTEVGKGNIIGELRNDRDSLCFSFVEQIMSDQGPLSRYFVVINGRISQVAVRKDIEKVWDIIVDDGRIVYVASLVGIHLPVLFVEDYMVTLPVPASAEIVSCSLFSVGDKIGAEGIYRFNDGTAYNAIWLDGKPVFTFGQGETISALGVHDGGIYCASNPGSSGRTGTIYRCGEVYAMPEQYVVMGNSCMAMVNGILHVGLSSTSGERPLIWKDGVVDTLGINGYVSSVSSSYAPRD